MRLALMVSLVISMCAAWPKVGADKPLVVEVWPSRAPDERSNISEEMVRMSPNLDRKQIEVGGNFKPLDVVAALSGDRNVLTIAVINQGRKSQPITLKLSGGELIDREQKRTITGPKKWSYNSPGKPPKVENHSLLIHRNFRPAGSFSIECYSLLIFPARILQAHRLKHRYF
jgi:hypothetical protein